MTVMGRYPVGMSLSDADGVPRMAVLHLTWSVDDAGPVCAVAGPAPGPGMLGYLCTRRADGHCTHEAWQGGVRLDSWPATPAPVGE